MTTLWKMLAALVVVALMTAVQPACVFACSCVPPPPPAEALANSTAVFAGQVTEIVAPANLGGPDPVQVTFAVSKGWKGAEQPTIVLNTSGSSASCGFEFVKGQEYLVYATTFEGRLETGLCTRTAQLDLAGDDLAALGDGTVPTGAPTGEEAPSEGPSTLPEAGNALSPYVIPAALGGGLLLIILLSSVMVTRRRTDA
jgi:hypothetical protein